MDEDKLKNLQALLQLLENGEEILQPNLEKIAELADKSNHHPDAEIVKCSTLILTLFTHDENAITYKDKDLALAIEKLISS